MIHELSIECEYITNIDSNYHSTLIKVDLKNVSNSFIGDIDAKEIVMFQDVKELLDAIGSDLILEWLNKQR